MSDYKRLTIREDNPLLDTICKNCERYNKPGCNEPYACYEAIIERLAELEDKIENKTLIDLPCKVGDKIYHISNKTIREEIVTTVKYIITNGKIDIYNSYILTNDPDDKYDNFYRLSKLGKSVFLTELRAQAKLKELKENKR